MKNYEICKGTGRCVLIISRKINQWKQREVAGITELAGEYFKIAIRNAFKDLKENKNSKET